MKNKDEISHNTIVSNLEIDIEYNFLYVSTTNNGDPYTLGIHKIENMIVTYLSALEYVRDDVIWINRDKNKDVNFISICGKVFYRIDKKLKNGEIKHEIEEIEEKV